ncbi:hypothetical protein [Methanolobus bombayensis]|uniref:hypothetical protein n=1 Tax=Methanolobus bombayensis TaxID=38023 RepID=UPI001AE17111|nr:hypothetical protein [Methanolobus bombayensis]MBP1909645.1 hypothetical protein [Methanolobus bombayensis]
MEGNISDLHMIFLCTHPEKNNCVLPHCFSNSYGLSFHFCLCGSEDERTVVAIRNYIADALQNIYPFEMSFVRDFSFRLLEDVKKLPFTAKGPRLMVKVLIEWISFATLILSSRKMIPADLKVKINSNDCVISCGLN